MRKARHDRNEALDLRWRGIRHGIRLQRGVEAAALGQNGRAGVLLNQDAGVLVPGGHAHQGPVRELDEVAGACQVSLATVKRRLTRARERFERLAARDPLLGAYVPKERA